MDERVRQGWIDVVSGGILVGIGLLARLALGRNETLTRFDFGTDPGPALLPRLLLVALMAGGAVLVILGASRLRAARATALDPARPLSLRPYARPAALGASLAVYLVVLPRVGFIAATLVFGTGWIAALTPPADRRPARRFLGQTAAAALIITAALYYVFKGFVKVPLP